ncbi:aminobenzoyl-glutamate transport protein [Halanaerobium saccharolyticum]|uniref:Aminobenzoyl-glutamate transport protein n=1 Tax=Halanaerobium saccharolyticum TaxID=43595 RepID=A0A4V3G607_9FIRM|nr:AbgT family transporter [Halanaerobium saccharolyticum]RAK11858.1 aminobenzoyl-glutamate transport protein [Halanaerobium saccharolyticum]TDW07699.1 aminobenzoyl-glutamate transport protein [Halanaerobium saccharolyticum]TDX64620.1 aminobenzoyl-glutamate transport protein [Halanaerobium saccharolyticum]
MLNNKENLSLTDRFLNRIERTGNKLPHPVILFFILSAFVLILSWIISLFEIAVTHPGTGETIRAVNLLSKSGIRRIFTEAVSNFTGFAPLGVVLVAMLGVGIAEKSGLISAVLKKTVLSAPDKYITAVVIFAGIMSNIASDAGYVVLVPLGAVIFAAKGRHPLVGLAAAFAGVSGGFSANLLLSTLDPLLAGLSQEAAQLIDSGYTIPPTVNYYFMVASTFLVTIIGTWVTEKIIAPRFGEYEGEHEEELEEITAEENAGIKSALIWLGVTLAVILLMTVPQNGILRSDAGNLIMGGTPFVGGMVPLIAIFFFVPGLAYGKKTGSIKNSDDIAQYLDSTMAGMGGYITLAFAAGQFVAYFNWSKLGTILAIGGAEFLQSINFTGLPLIILFIVVAGFINLFIGSASAKWAIMAPVFVPMLMQLGYSPEFAQMAYRIGDSTTNIITPLMPYFAIIIAFAKKYDEDIGIGTLISTMVPYSIAFMIGWTILLVIWFIFNLPIGPGGVLFY